MYRFFCAPVCTSAFPSQLSPSIGANGGAASTGCSHEPTLVSRGSLALTAYMSKPRYLAVSITGVSVKVHLGPTSDSQSHMPTQSGSRFMLPGQRRHWGPGQRRFVGSSFCWHSHCGAPALRVAWIWRCVTLISSVMSSPGDQLVLEVSKL